MLQADSSATLPRVTVFIPLLITPIFFTMYFPGLRRRSTKLLSLIATWSMTLWPPHNTCGPMPEA